jgi:hypothetical protein
MANKEYLIGFKLFYANIEGLTKNLVKIAA